MPRSFWGSGDHHSFFRHAREIPGSSPGRGPGATNELLQPWIPAFAGMTIGGRPYPARLSFGPRRSSIWAVNRTVKENTITVVPMTLISGVTPRRIEEKT